MMPEVANKKEMHEFYEMELMKMDRSRDRIREALLLELCRMEANTNEAVEQMTKDMYLGATL